MHFALPPRKTSHPPPYARQSVRSISSRRESQIKAACLFLVGLIGLYVLVRPFMTHGSQGNLSDEDASSLSPNIVIVTILDEKAMSKNFIDKIKANREDYASRNGYTNFFTNVSTYASLYQPSPKSWALLPALRHTLTLHPSSTHIFSLSSRALIMSPSKSLEEHILSPNVLQSLMRKDVPVVPPDSVIHTFPHITPSKTDLIISQDADNLAHTSFILRNSDWARFFLDAWFDPLYREYNFQKAEGHALEHIVQWHPTILARLVLIDQRMINSYTFESPPVEDQQTGEIIEHDSMWKEGDLVVNFKGCDESKTRNCEEEMDEYFEKWQAQVARLN